MIRMIEYVRHPLIQQFVKFCIVGTSNFVLDMALYLFLTRITHVQFLLANGISFFLVVTWSYYWNKRWTFADRGIMRMTQYVQFVIVVLVGLLLAEAGLWVLVRQFQLYDLVAKFVTGTVVAFWNFGMNRFWTFAAIDTQSGVWYTRPKGNE